MSYPYAKRGEVTDTYFGTVVQILTVGWKTPAQRRPFSL